MKDRAFALWGSSSRRYFYKPVTKEKYSDKLDLPTVSTTLQNMKDHAMVQKVSTIGMPKIGCGLNQMNWKDVVKLLRFFLVVQICKLWSIH